MTITKMENRSGVLIDGLKWFVKSYFPVIVLTLLFPVINLKVLFKYWKYKKGFFARRENFLFSGLFIWAVCGFCRNFDPKIVVVAISLFSADDSDGNSCG